jgi:hypothetical protein
MTDHIGDDNKLVCLHCGLPSDQEQNGIQGYRCGSSYCEAFQPQWARSMTCLELENRELKDTIELLRDLLFERGEKIIQHWKASKEAKP